MTNKAIEVKVPGKLMIAGEYAVLEPNQKAVVIAVNKYVTAYIRPNIQYELSAPHLLIEPIPFKLRGNTVEFSVEDPRLAFVKSAISTAALFLREKSIKVAPFYLELKSQLDDPISGRKYGLGSSAAVVAAVIEAVILLNSGIKEAPKSEELFKLSAITHFKAQGSGSGADIAAAVYGGWLQYSAFDGSWLLRKLKQGEKLISLVEESWPNLLIMPINPPTSLKIAVGWTKKAAATAPMIKKVQYFCENNSEQYRQFLKDSSLAVGKLIESFEKADCGAAIISLSENRRVLQRLGINADMDIETSELKALCDIAEDYGSGKSSGAGGGDCGIAFLKDNSKRQELYNAWEMADISPLDLCVSKAGVSVKQD